MKKQKRIVPNVIRGGVAIPLGANYFLMKGKTHEQGGIDIGKDLEVENGELMKIDKNNMTIVSNAPIMNGISPAEYALGGLKDGTFTDRFKEGFKYQEKYKDINGLKDDGTKANFGIFKKLFNGENKKDDTKKLVFNPTANAKKEYNKVKGFVRVNENDSPSKEESEKLENDIAQRQKSMYHIAKNKGYDSEPYYLEYIPEKEIILKGAGRVSSNMIDSIAVNSKKAGTPFIDALGLFVEETKGGASPNLSTESWVEKFEKQNGRKPSDDEIHKFENAALNASFARNYGGIYPQFAINDHEWHQRGWEESPKYKAILSGIESPLEHGFTLYNLGLYNSGDRYHTNKVKAAGQKAINSKAIQQWLQTSPYAKDIIMKLGGKADMKQNDRNVPSTGEKKKAELGKRTDYLDLLIPGGATKAVSKISSKLPDKLVSNVETPKLKSVSEAFVEPTDDRKPLTPQQKEELISGILEGGAALTSAGMLAATTGSNNKMLNNLQRYQDPTKPILSTRQRLKTSVNVNPQLTKSKRILDKTNKFVLNNTGSSQSAYNRIRQNNFDYIDRINNIYSQKENTETGLINQDRTADNENVRYNNGLINQYLNRKDQIGLANTELDNTIAEKKAENKAALYQGISDIVTNMVTNYGKRKQNNKKLRVMAAGFPSITPEYLNEILYR